MRLTKFEITNFKSFGEKTQKIEFKPITLLYGPNSSGKSAVFHALHYFYEVLAHNNCDPGSVHLAEGINLGGFDNLINKHESRNSIKLRLDFEVGTSLVPTYGFFDGDEIYIFNMEGKTDYLNDICVVESFGIEVVIRWSNIRNRAYVSDYKVYIENEPFCSIESNTDGQQIVLKEINFSNSFLQSRDPNDDLEEKIPLESIMNQIYGSKNEISILQVKNALPNWGEILKTQYSYSEENSNSEMY